ncbi:MAG TPA: hypothetical protein VNL18_13855 [Gemmatimonadales bacterium]|nr:hypothetical protein [Gemmatimonadales bacterium]
MMQLIRVFVNERPVDVAPGADLTAAVAALDPSLAAALADGRAYATDGVGRPIAGTEPVVAGAIIRVVRSARKAAEA